MFSRVTVIVNASAGADDKQGLAQSIEGPLRKAGIKGHVVLAQSGANVREAALQAMQTHPDAIIAGGGDGTINAVATTLIGTDIALGVLPLGTLNHFAKDMRIPLDLEHALRNVIAGHTVAVDVGEVNGRYFLNNSSIGIYPRVVRDREQQRRAGRGKWIAFAGAVLSALRRHSFLRVLLAANSQERIHRTPFVFVGNNEYQMEGFNLGTRGCLNAGQLSVYTVKRERRWALLRLALRALFARLRQSKDFDFFCASEVRIESGHRHVQVAIDGEVMRMDTPLHYRVRPAALRVIVPESLA
ncbi:MAG: diacylglycerol kinase family protein [Betaproteobacteria bacterium]